MAPDFLSDVIIIIEMIIITVQYIVYVMYLVIVISSKYSECDFVLTEKTHIVLIIIDTTGFFQEP